MNRSMRTRRELQAYIALVSDGQSVPHPEMIDNPKLQAAALRAYERARGVLTADCIEELTHLDDESFAEGLQILAGKISRDPVEACSQIGALAKHWRQERAAQITRRAQIERAVLGAMLLDQHAVSFALGELAPEDFRTESHREIFLAIMALSASGAPCDLVNVAEELRARGTLRKIGGSAQLSGIQDDVATAAHIEEHVAMLRDPARVHETRARRK